MESFTSLTVPEEDRSSLTDYLQRQGHQPSSLPQSFPGIPTSGFFAPNQLNAFATPWSPNPISLRPDCSHRPNGPINYSLNQRPDSTGVPGMSMAAEDSRDSIVFSSPSGSIPIGNNRSHMPQLHKCQPPKQVPAKSYKCGGCYMSFDTICKLHKHLRCHGGSGSYVYDNITQTAHPRKGSKTCETQTGVVCEPKHEAGKTVSGNTQDAAKVKEHIDFVEKLLDGTIDNNNAETNEEKMEDRDDKTEEKTEEEVVIKEEKEEEIDDGKRRSSRKVTPVIRSTVLLQREFQKFIQRKKKKMKKCIKRTVKVQCPQCSLEFPTKSTPKAEKEKQKIRRVKCDICLKQVNSVNALKHIKKCLGMPAFICPRPGCGKKFTRRYTLMQHQKLHGDGEPFTCDVCGMAFPTTEKLAKHMNYHTEKRPFKCPLCPFCFKTKQHLMRHEKTHTKETPFSCPTCYRKFSQEGNLKTHMRTHTDERPYVCHICGKGFKYNVSKKKHLKVHDEDSLGCSESASITRNILADVAAMQAQMPSAIPISMMYGHEGHN